MAPCLLGPLGGIQRFLFTTPVIGRFARGLLGCFLCRACLALGDAPGQLRLALGELTGLLLLGLDVARRLLGRFGLAALRLGLTVDTFAIAYVAFNPRGLGINSARRGLCAIVDLAHLGQTLVHEELAVALGLAGLAVVLGRVAHRHRLCTHGARFVHQLNLLFGVDRTLAGVCSRRLGRGTGRSGQDEQ